MLQTVGLTKNNVAIPFQETLCRTVPEHVSLSSDYSGQATSYHSHHQAGRAVCHSMEVAEISDTYEIIHKRKKQTKTKKT